MSDIPRKREWGNSLTLIDEPPVSLQDDGYPGGEQPFGEHHNWIFNQADKNQNDLVHDRNYAQSVSAGIDIGFQASGFWNLSDWLHSYSTRNAFTMASFPRSLAPGYNYTERRPSIYVARNGFQGITEVHNGDSGALVTTDHALTLNNAAEEVEAIASDGPFVYVMTTGEPGFQATFYKFDVNPWSSTKVWSLTSSLFFDQSNRGINHLIIADSDWIAAPCTNTTPDTGISVLLINKDGLSSAAGRGNAPSNSLYKPSPTLVSNGTNLFFLLEDTGAPGQFPTFCSANIADPTLATNPGGPITNDVIGAETQAAGMGSLIYDGRLVHMLSSYGKIYSYDWDTDTFQGASHEQWEISDTLTPAQGPDHPSMTFDGLRAWALVGYQGSTGITGSFVVPVNVAEEAMDDSAAKTINGPKQMLQPPFTTNNLTGSKLVFADNCLWMTININTGSPGTTLMRLPIARR